MFYNSSCHWTMTGAMLIISCYSEIENSLMFWYRLMRINLEHWLLNKCSCSNSRNRNNNLTVLCRSVSALTLLGDRKGMWSVKSWMLVCWW